MTIQEAIEGAVENGWVADGRYFRERTWRGHHDRTRAILGDPLFWQALGKAMGWEVQFDEDKGFNYQWKDYWHRLIDHLAEGKSIELFFAELK